MSQRLPALAAFILFLSVLVQPALAQERRPARIGGKPNLNGIWQAANEAHWNLEGHSAESLAEFASTMGAVAAFRPAIASSSAARFRICPRRSPSAPRTAPAGRRRIPRPSA